MQSERMKCIHPGRMKIIQAEIVKSFPKFTINHVQTMKYIRAKIIERIGANPIVWMEINHVRYQSYKETKPFPGPLWVNIEES